MFQIKKILRQLSKSRELLFKFEKVKMPKKIQETDAHRIYGPYLDTKTKTKIGWWVIPAHGKKKVFRSKTKMLEYVDLITTDLPKRKPIIVL